MHWLGLRWRVLWGLGAAAIMLTLMAQVWSANRLIEVVRCGKYAAGIAHGGVYFARNKRYPVETMYYSVGAPGMRCYHNDNNNQFALWFKKDLMSGAWVTAPLWVVAIGFAGLAGWSWRNDRSLRRRLKSMKCSCCGYDLSKHDRAAICPECGSSAWKRNRVVLVCGGLHSRPTLRRTLMTSCGVIGIAILVVWIASAGRTIRICGVGQGSSLWVSHGGMYIGAGKLISVHSSSDGAGSSKSSRRLLALGWWFPPPQSILSEWEIVPGWMVGLPFTCLAGYALVLELRSRRIDRTARLQAEGDSTSRVALIR